jgi:hypothetical protein
MSHALLLECVNKLTSNKDINLLIYQIYVVKYHKFLMLDQVQIYVVAIRYHARPDYVLITYYDPITKNAGQYMFINIARLKSEYCIIYTFNLIERIFSSQ